MKIRFMCCGWMTQMRTPTNDLRYDLWYGSQIWNPRLSPDKRLKCVQNTACDVSTTDEWNPTLAAEHVQLIAAKKQRLSKLRILVKVEQVSSAFDSCAVAEWRRWELPPIILGTTSDTDHKYKTQVLTNAWSVFRTPLATCRSPMSETPPLTAEHAQLIAEKKQRLRKMRILWKVEQVSSAFDSCAVAEWRRRKLLPMISFR